LSIRSLAKKVRDQINPDIQIEMSKAQTSSSCRHRYIPDISRVRNELSLDVLIGLDLSIQKSVLWYARFQQFSK
jgi:nucleoside-diphosphate-sugar epimerase